MIILPNGSLKYYRMNVLSNVESIQTKNPLGRTFYKSRYHKILNNVQLNCIRNDVQIRI